MLPKAFGAFGLSMGATAIFLSNVHFWQLTGYFDGGSATEPLLHTWSLSIEEQYYLLFPAMLCLLWRFLPRPAVIGTVLALALLSLAVGQWGWGYRPDVNYFFTPSRLWELLAGSLAALMPGWLRGHRPPSAVGTKLRGFLALAGLGVIVSAMLTFDDGTPHPALPTLWPVAGSVLVLVFARPDGWATRLLSTAPFVAIGLISYSLYLWHQPVLVFSRLVEPDLAGPMAIALQLCVTFALGALSWRFVEQPFRLGHPGKTPAERAAPSRKRLPPRRVVLISAAILAALFGAGLLADTGRDTARRYLMADTAGRALLDFTVDGNGAVDRYYMHNICLLDGPLPPDTGDRCLPGTGTRSTVIWGDSHAAALAHGLRNALPDFGQLTTSGCAPILSTAPLFPEKCQRNNGDMMRLLVANPPETLLLHANWIHREGQLPFFGPSLPELVRSLPGTRIVVLGGMPQWQPGLPERIFDAELPLAPGLRVATDITAITAADDQLSAGIEQAGFKDRIALIRLTDLLCRTGTCGAAFEENGVVEPLVWDYGHLTAIGSGQLAARLAEALAERPGSATNP